MEFGKLLAAPTNQTTATGSLLFRFILDSLWWAHVAMATAGYGDVYPVTSAGRAIAGSVMSVGISAFSMVTASVARFLLRDN